MVGTLKFVKYKVGGTQNLELYRNKIPFLLKYVLMHVKPEGMTQFDVFHTSVENSVKSEFLFL